MGLSFGASMSKIVIPQAVKNILPTLGNEFIALIKETSVVSFVGAADLYVAFNYIGTNNYHGSVSGDGADLYRHRTCDHTAGQITGKEPEEE